MLNPAVPANNLAALNVIYPQLTTVISSGVNRSSLVDSTNQQGNSGDILTLSGQVNFNTPANIPNNNLGTGNILPNPIFNSTMNAVKTGDGTLELGGNVSNIGQGSMFVDAGTLALNKTGNAVALPMGNIFIGDNDLGQGSSLDQIVYRPTATNNQITTGANVVVNRSGQYDVANRTQTINVLSIDKGTVLETTGGNLQIARAIMAGGKIDTGNNVVAPALPGVLGLTAGVANANDASAHSFEFQPSAQIATVNGSISLNNGFRTFVVAQQGNTTFEGPNLYDAVINASINGGSPTALLP